uniref:Uncharacterized protein n=1 Tax=Arundo donax TaxID=35708 RepID=A0A0A8ZHP4_ARUDO
MFTKRTKCMEKQLRKKEAIFFAACFVSVWFECVVLHRSCKILHGAYNLLQIIPSLDCEKLDTLACLFCRMICFLAVSKEKQETEASVH